MRLFGYFGEFVFLSTIMSFAPFLRLTRVTIVFLFISFRYFYEI